MNDGLGVFTDSGQFLGSSADDFQSVVLGDVDGDGDLDAVVSNEGERPTYAYIIDGLGVFLDSGRALGDEDSHTQHSVTWTMMGTSISLSLTMINHVESTF